MKFSVRRLALFLVSLTVFPLHESHAAATPYCKPDTGENVPANNSCVGQLCQTHGSTTMDRNGENIVACLKVKNANNVYEQRWKAMTQSASTGGAGCYHISIHTGVINMMSQQLGPWYYSSWGALPAGLTASSIAQLLSAQGVGTYSACRSGYTRLSCDTAPVGPEVAPWVQPGCTVIDHTSCWDNGQEGSGCNLNGYSTGITCCVAPQ